MGNYMKGLDVHCAHSKIFFVHFFDVLFLFCIEKYDPTYKTFNGQVQIAFVRFLVIRKSILMRAF